MTSSQLHDGQNHQSNIGELGEEFAVTFERKRLPKFLQSKIVRFGEHDVAMGYDILSFESSLSLLPDRYIEVKTFRGHPHFYWSENEIAAARKYADHYYLYLIDIDRINDAAYEPQIIANPAVLFDDKKLWSSTPYQYAFSLNADANIPSDWDGSTVLLGCYNSQEHLKWILANNLYNIRSSRPSNSEQKSIRKAMDGIVAEPFPSNYNAPGSVRLTPEVIQATYLLLYSVGAPRSYMLFRLQPFVKRATRNELTSLGYKEPHCQYYLLHHIAEKLPSFHIDMAQLLRDACPKDTAFVGTPIYLAGAQIRRYMHTCADLSATYHIPYRAWTPELDDELIRLYDSRVRFNEIAIRLHRSTNSIIYRLRKLGKIKPKQ